MSPERERIEILWKDGGDHESRGPLFADRNKLENAFQSVIQLEQLPSNVETLNNSLVTTPFAFQTKSSPFSPDVQKKSFHFITKARHSEVGSLHLAIQEQAKQDSELVDTSIYEYILNADGTVIGKNELHPGIDNAVSTEEIDLIKKAIDIISDGVETSTSRMRTDLQNAERDRIREKQYRRERLVRVIGWGAGAVIALGGLGYGGVWAWTEWIHKPGQADDLKRAAYDAQEYVIDGSAIELDDQRFAVIPQDTFDEIPTFRGGDTLEHPRIVTLGSSSNCAQIEIKELEGKSVKIAVAEYNPLGAYDVVAYESENKLNVCTTDKINSSGFSSDNYKIAVQLVEDRS